MEALQEVSAVAERVDLGVPLQCPRCTLPLPKYVCEICGFILQEENGIWRAMPKERIAHYARFVREYELIRSAEGRGNAEADFYLNLPYKDISGRNSAQWMIRARTFDYLRRHILAQIPQSLPMRILDIGAGNGWMSYRLSYEGYEVIAIDLLTNGRDGLGAAEHYRTRLPKLFLRFQAESAHLPFVNDEFDLVIFNASFHYSEDYCASLSEALRCLRPGGLVVISDTPWYARNDSGQRMVAERRKHFLSTYGTASDSIQSMEYLTEERLKAMEQYLSIRWEVHTPWYGLRWAARPLLARLRGRREPSRFRIYTTRKNA